MSDIKKEYNDKNLEYSLWLFTATLGTWSVTDKVIQLLSLTMLAFLFIFVFRRLKSIEENIFGHSSWARVKYLFSVQGLPIFITFLFLYITIFYYLFNISFVKENIIIITTMGVLLGVLILFFLNRYEKKSHPTQPIISRFYDIDIQSCCFDNEQCNTPHIYAKHQDYSATFAIETSEKLAGDFPVGKAHMVQAWIEIHRESLMANRELVINGHTPFKIPALQ